MFYQLLTVVALLVNYKLYSPTKRHPFKKKNAILTGLSVVVISYIVNLINQYYISNQLLSTIFWIFTVVGTYGIFYFHQFRNEVTLNWRVHDSQSYVRSIAPRWKIIKSRLTLSDKTTIDITEVFANNVPVPLSKLDHR